MPLALVLPLVLFRPLNVADADPAVPYLVSAPWWFWRLIHHAH
jgi:hypothetical protein